MKSGFLFLSLGIVMMAEEFRPCGILSNDRTRLAVTVRLQADSDRSCGKERLNQRIAAIRRETDCDWPSDIAKQLVNSGPDPIAVWRRYCLRHQAVSHPR